MVDIQPHNTVTCITHTDADGIFSGLLVARKYPQTQVYQTNYGKDFDESKVGDFTFVTDFSFDSLETLQRIASKTTLIWIDHHTIVDKAREANFNPEGLRRRDCSAAKLVYEYLYPNQQVPIAIQYISDYDTWVWQNNMNALYFHYGLGMIDLKPNDRKTMKLFETILTDSNYTERICIIGKRIDDYIQTHNKIVMEDCVFETELDGVKAIACNIKNTNSLVFASVEDKYKNIPLRILFSYFSNINKYRVSIFTNDTEKYPVDILASKFSGGGHPGAAGFTINALPFKLPEQKEPPVHKNIIKDIQLMVMEDPLVRRYASTGYIPLIWSHQYQTTLDPYSAVAVNNPTAFQDAFYSTGLNNLYELGIFVSLTSSGWYRYRIHILDPRLNIVEVKDRLQKEMRIQHTDVVLDGNALWFYANQLPEIGYRF